MEKIYVVRKFVSIEGGARHYYEEEVFSSFQRAFKFMKLISEEEDDFFLSELITCCLDNNNIDVEKDVQIYDYKGRLLFASTQVSDVCQSKKSFSIGDIVKISPFPWNQQSPTCVPTICVVSKTPVASDEEYIVDYIRDGFLGHWHVEGAALKEHGEDMPENLVFLTELANHYKGIKSIPEKTLNAVYKGEIFVEKVQHYNFV
ncbi:MAG TPA: hypothetical protein EYP35_05420 [Desulfobacterales bacterium]|nr:hypothetical protein [Desulfobacterales bacterium]